MVRAAFIVVLIKNLLIVSSLYVCILDLSEVHKPIIITGIRLGREAGVRVL